MKDEIINVNLQGGYFVDITPGKGNPSRVTGTGVDEEEAVACYLDKFEADQGFRPDLEITYIPHPLQEESAVEKNVVRYVANDGQKVTLSFDHIRNFLVQGKAEFVTRQELVFFMGVCKSRGLNPFIKDCYLVKYAREGNAAIVTSVDYFRKRARSKADYDGHECGIVCWDPKKKEPRYSKGILLPGETLLGGWFKATPRGLSTPIQLEVQLESYIQTKIDGKPTRFWAPARQPMMIRKVAESAGLRMAWPDEFQQVFTDMEVAEDGAEDITDVAEHEDFDLAVDQPEGEVSEQPKETGQEEPPKDEGQPPKPVEKHAKGKTPKAGQGETTQGKQKKAGTGFIDCPETRTSRIMQMCYDNCPGLGRHKCEEFKSRTAGQKS